MWFYVEQYPTTTSGKIQKFALRDRISKGLMTPEPFEKPVASRFA
jgi:acyl-coenzyme A synthetase/AMP-(fatty) acid ligase